jgi:hypothetical protein
VLTDYCGMVNAKIPEGGFTGYLPFYAAVSDAGGKVDRAFVIATGTSDEGRNREIRQTCARAGYLLEDPR